MAYSTHGKDRWHTAHMEETDGIQHTWKRSALDMHIRETSSRYYIYDYITNIFARSKYIHSNHHQCTINIQSAG